VETDLAQIIFSLKTDNQKIINTLITIVDNKLFQVSQKNAENMLEYIDIRFGNKVFYKYKNGNKIATTTETIILEQSTTTGR
jgi:predicted transposase YdaD